MTGRGETRFDTLGPTLTVATVPADPAGGDRVTATAHLINDCPFPLCDAVLHLIAPGATTAAKTIPLGDLRRGAKVTRSWQTTMPADVAGDVSFTAHLVFDVDGHKSHRLRVPPRSPRSRSPRRTTPAGGPEPG